MRKSIYKIIIVCLVFCTMAVPVFAESTRVTEDYQTRFTNINVFMNHLEISDSGKASVTTHINGRDCDQVKVVAYLQQYKDGQWKTIKSWSETSEGTIGGIGKSYYVMSGNSYRLKSYGYVYGEGKLLDKTSYVGDTIKY